MFQYTPLLSAMKIKRAIATYFAAAVICLFVFACATSNTLVQSKESTTKSADGSRIVYGISGQGEPAIVFVHGWLGDHTVWQYQVDYFSDRHQVVWLDLAGHGASSANRQRFAITAFAQDVAAVVDAVDGKKVVLVGHSMGGPIVIEAAKLLGERVVGIVGVDAFYTPLAAVPENMKLAFLERLKTSYATALAETVNSMFTQNADQAYRDATYDKMLAADHSMGISALYECIKWNSEKEPLELTTFAGALANINGAPTGHEKKLHESVVLIPGVGHFVARLKPEEFNAALEMILERFTTQ